MNSDSLRQKFLAFFEDKGHKIIPSASLIPKTEVDIAGTQKVLFTTAGMHPLVPYLLGEPHPAGKRLVNIQKCLRTDDIEEVGDSVHCTFFEMLGNWSFGDSASSASQSGPASPDGVGLGGPASPASQGGYWKEEAISLSWEFLTKVLGLDEKRLYISVFEGDSDAPFDKESYDAWIKVGIPKERIFKYGKKENWWGPVGKSGPCGPDTEMFYDVLGGDLAGDEPSTNSQRFVEIWNDVFMEYEKQPDGTYKPLKQKNVDTGMGLERILAVIEGKENIYETEIFAPVINLIKEKSQKFNLKDARIIADHMKAAFFLSSESLQPSNKEQGYILRRLIRRAIAKADYSLDSSVSFEEIINKYLEIYKDFYPELIGSKDKIRDTILAEKENFAKTLAQGIREFEKIAQKSTGKISGEKAFFLQATHGLTIDIISDLAKEANLQVDTSDFEEEFKKHQEVSRAGMEKKFAGGLGDKTSPKIIAGHTATHLLHKALREILGDHVAQIGSNITEERVRFDFSHTEKLTDEEIKKVEDLVNKKINENLPVKKEIMTQDEARKSGAIGLFGEKYGEEVSVYSIGDPSAVRGQVFSKEFCGGPHVSSTKEIRHLKIIKEEGLGQGKRRIYAKVG